MRSVIWVFAAGCLLYLLWAALIFVEQRRTMYVSWGAPVGEPHDLPPDLVRFWIDVPGGRVEAWYLPPRRPGPALVPAVLFAHGNAETIDAWPEELEGFRALGLGVMLVELPGYGRSTGAPTQDSIREAFVSGYDLLRSQPGIDGQRIVGFGRSLGGGAICELLRQRPLAAVILMSTFPSTRMFSTRYLLSSILVRDPLRQRRGAPPLRWARARAARQARSGGAVRAHRGAPRGSEEFDPARL